MSNILKSSMAFVVACGMLAPLAAQAQTKSSSGSEDGASDSASKDASKSDGASEFERTRQHMIEKNRESQRTGKM